MLRGELILSFYYHPVVLYTACILLFLVLSYCLSKVLHRETHKNYRYEWFAYVGIGIIMINWAVKNYYLIVKGIDLLVSLE